MRGPVRALADAGVATTVACLPHQTSSALTAAAAHVTWLDRPRAVLGDAAVVADASAVRETPVAVAVHARRGAIPAHIRLGLAA